jgi:hypothetical protein
MRPRQPQTHRSQRGVTLIWMAFFLLVMIAFIGLGADMARLMATRNQLQGAADAAALAGASAYETSSGDSNAVIAAVVARATEWALKNKAFEGVPTAVSVPGEDIVANYAQRTVTVITRREGATGMVTYFARVIPGLAKLTMRATATAKGEGGCNLWPVAGRPDPGPEFVVGCTEYTLKYPGGSGTTGSYGMLDLSYTDCPGDPCEGTGHGSAAYFCYLVNGFHCCIDSNTCIKSQTGVSTGKTVQGIQARFDADTDQRPRICYFGTDGYHGNGSRLVQVPITGPEMGGGSSRCYVLNRYGKFFLTRIPGKGSENDIYANFLGYDSAAGLTSGNFHVFLIK